MKLKISIIILMCSFILQTASKNAGDNNTARIVIVKKSDHKLASELLNKHIALSLKVGKNSAYRNTTKIILTRTIVKRETPSDHELLGKNISVILENLLKSYEKSQTPSHGQATATLVRTNMLIRSMGPVSEQNMEYSMDCYFRQYWKDKRLSFRGPIKSLSLSIKMLDKIWRPDTYFYNGKQSHIHTITVPNKLLRLSQDGEILYSMRLTIKASCPMKLRNFPMDRQSCPLIIGSYAYTKKQLIYEWHGNEAVSFVPGMTLNQFDLISMPYKNYSFTRTEGQFSVLHISFNLKRHTGYFVIQVYVPCILIVVLSWVSFWIHREATSDRVGLCITTVLTLSTISLDSRTDLPKVKHATALDWFLLMSFFYCIATLLEFAGVHYFTKVGSGEIPMECDNESLEMTEDSTNSASLKRSKCSRQNYLLQTEKMWHNSKKKKKKMRKYIIQNITQFQNCIRHGYASLAMINFDAKDNVKHFKVVSRSTVFR